MTKKDYLKAIYSLIESFDNDEYDNYLDFLSKEINALTVKAERAKEKAAANRADSDELADLIADTVPNEFKTIAEIISMINRPEATNGKVVYRLNALVADGVLEKGMELIGKKKVVVYKHC